MTQTNLSVPTVVLVHAAWADASSWGKIIPPLQRRGLQAVAVQIPLSSLSDDAGWCCWWVTPTGARLSRLRVAGTPW